MSVALIVGAGSGIAAVPVIPSAAVAGAAALVYVERRATDPLLPRRLLRRRVFLVIVILPAAAGLGGAGFGTVEFAAGYARAPRVATLIAVACIPVAAWLVMSVPRRPPPHLGYSRPCTAT